MKSVSVLALLDLGSEVNALHSTLARELRLPIRPTNVGEQKINGTMLDTFGMVVIAFSVTNKANQVKFFEKTFLVANVSLKVILGMSFPTLSDADVDFLSWKLRWRIYTTKEALPTTQSIELVGKKEFTATALDPGHETHVVHVGSVGFAVLPSFSPLELDVYPFCRPQVSGLIVEEASIKIPAEYSDFADVFSADLASELLGHNGINDHAIELVGDCQQPSYGPIYSLEPLELETVKA